MEGIGWSITHYLKQILVVLDEDFSSELWSLYFVCGNEDELKTCREILEKKFKRNKMEARIKSFPIQGRFFIPSRNLLQGEYSIAAACGIARVCVSSAWKQVIKKTLARIFIKLCTLIWHGKRTNTSNFQVN